RVGGGRSAGDRLHRKGIARRSAGRAGRVLSHSLPGSFVSERARFAAGRAFSHGAERTAHHLVRLVGRYRRWRLRHRRGARGHAHLFDHVEIPARFFHSLWRPHLCRLSAARGAKLPNGEVWRNIVTEEKSKIAQTLADFRGNYKYNLLDKNVLAFNAEVPLFAQWDDHEVTNDWCPGEAL